MWKLICKWPALHFWDAVPGFGPTCTAAIAGTYLFHVSVQCGSGVAHPKWKCSTHQFITVQTLLHLCLRYNSKLGDIRWLWVRAPTPTAFQTSSTILLSSSTEIQGLFQVTPHYRTGQLVNLVCTLQHLQANLLCCGRWEVVIAIWIKLVDAKLGSCCPKIGILAQVALNGGPKLWSTLISAPVAPVLRQWRCSGYQHV